MFQSTWGQQNQQQPSTSAFGQPPAFSTPTNTNTAFGSTNTFGQPQQPQINPMFGNISTTPSTNPGTSAFGTFGSNPSTSTSVFGAPKPASGFGAFSGGTGTFGSGTSAFGQPTTTSNASAFGQPSTSTSAFGGGSNLFGNKSAFGGTGTTAPPTVTTGTANPAYASISEKDGATTLQYQSLTFMPAYVGYSFEELRIQDYTQGRKTATNASAFGATTTSAFGTTQPGATNVFGQPAQQPNASLFGTNTNTNTTGFGAFGQPPSTNTNNGFGSGVFGQTQPQTQPQQSNPFGAAGAFGQPQQQQQQQQQTSSLFGGSTTSAFGNNANKPGFGTFGGGTGGFGSTGTTSAFGTNPQQNQPAQGTGLFGTAPSTGTSAFNAFGGNNASKPSIFGTNPGQPATNNPFGGGLFGTNQQQPSQPSTFGTGTGGFSSTFGTNVPQNQPTTSLFGNPPQNTSALTTTGAGLFGNTQQNPAAQQTQQPSNPFGNLLGQRTTQPTGPSLFGGSLQMTQPQQQPSLFGNSTTGQQGSSIFGKPAAPALGMSLSGNTNTGQGMFGNSTATPGIQGTLTASIAQPIGENLPIFDMLPPGPRIISLDQTLPKKKAGFFLDMPTRSPVPRVPLGYSPATSKLRGFGSMTLGPSASFNGISLTSGKPGALVLNKTETRGTSVGPDFLGRSSSPALGSGARQSVKKVILDKKIDPSELFVKSASPSGLKSGKVTFSPQLSVASREKDAELAAAQSLDSSASASRLQGLQQPKSMSGFGAKGTKETTGTETKEKTEDELIDGDYWVKPELSTLKKAGYDDLSSYPKLVVGRKGYGEIHLLEPVDLTGLPKLGALLGDVVRFDDKECSVYPDSDEADKPPPGSGLNVKARLILERCWANDKATREPIKDSNHPQHVKHLKKLKNMKDTNFESFDMTTGTWTFTVDHF